MGQFLLRMFGFRVVLVVFRRVLLGGKQRRQGNIHHAHFRVIDVLGMEHLLALSHPVEIGGDDIPHLAQPLPVFCRG